MLSRYIVAALATVLLVGCGYSPDKPVYDIAANPDNFPPLALGLLDDIEGNRRTSFEEISEAFADLYTEHSELLDNDAWKRIIDRLGARLSYKADQALKNGLSDFTRAAGYYVLAAFARPSDRAIIRRSVLFSTWLDALRDSRTSALVDSLFSNASVYTRLRLARRFALADSLHREFAREYLIGELFGPRFGNITPSQRDGLRLPDVALASHLGLVDPPTNRSLVSFGDGSIDLICADASPIDSNVYLAELYFFPRENLEVDYTIFLRVSAADSSLRSPSDPSRFVPFDFQPEIPTSRWEKGKLAVAYRAIEFLGPIREVSVGLMDKGVRPAEFLSLVGGDERIYRLVLPEAETQ